MKTPTLPRCPELPSHILCLAGMRQHCFVSVKEYDGGLYFMPMVSYMNYEGQHRTTRLADDVGDLPDFSDNGSRQCFIWGYANIEDALSVVHAINNHLTEE